MLFHFILTFSFQPLFLNFITNHTFEYFRLIALIKNNWCCLMMIILRIYMMMGIISMSKVMMMIILMMMRIILLIIRRTSWWTTLSTGTLLAAMWKTRRDQLIGKMGWEVYLTGALWSKLIENQHCWSSTEHNIPFSCCSKEFSKITGGSSCKTRLSFWLFAGILLLQVSHSFKRE